MPKIQFRKKLHLGKKNLVQLELVNSIIEEYQAQGYLLTLRQLYYQLVSKDVIPNNVREYDKLSTLLVKGRMAGVVDWDAIEDRVRKPHLPYYAEDVDGAIEDIVDSYRIDRQLGQENYIELWVEKDALSSVLKRKTHHYHIRLMVNRGYSSCTAMYDAYNRFKRAHDNGQNLHILYLGDFDPSGRDMLRDIDGRLEEFGAKTNVHSIALTMDQIKQYDPPPNPAKVSDPRAKEYIAAWGDTSWEVDALNPKTLHEVIDTNMEALLDMDLFNEQMAREKMEKEEISKLPTYKGSLLSIREFIDDKLKAKSKGKKLPPEFKGLNLVSDYLIDNYNI